MKILMTGLAAVALAVAVSSNQAAGQSYPNRPIKLVVPFGAGQGADSGARLVAQKLAESLKQAVYIENRPGAGGNIGADAVAKAPPDGYTLLVGSNGTHAANAALYDSLPFDPQKDFVPLAYIASAPMVLIAGPSFPASSLAELISMAKAKPGYINVAIPSSTSRVVFELLQTSSGAQFNAVPYKASASAVSDVLGGHVDLSIDTIIAVTPLVADKKVRPLGVSSLTRATSLKDIPTFAENGLQNFNLTAWNVWFAPKGTPPEIVSKLHDELVKVVADPEVQRQLRTIGFEPGGPDNPEQVAAFIATEAQKWGDLIRRAGIKAE
jgi:tripartite-type tricarboxylate transporter receptor subunit TctC